ncbi:hypothetical protein D037_2987A, partial [Vibrio parahaemolyticus IDH02640]
MSIGSYQRA